MKKTIYLLIAIFVLAFSLAQAQAARAQEECRDSTGAVIPCPPTEEPSTGGGSDDNSGGGSQPGGGNPNPPTDITATPSPTPSPEPTNTPLPIKDKPTQDPTKNAPVFEVTPTPTAEPVITSSSNDGATEGENDWEDICTFDLCLGLIAACYWDGGTPQIVEDGSGNTGVHCTIPDGDDGAAAPFPWGPVIITGSFVVLMVMLLPAVQKIREAAARSSYGGQTKEHVLLNKEEGGGTEAAYLKLGDIKGESTDKKPAPKDPIGKEDIIKREDKDKG